MLTLLAVQDPSGFGALFQTYGFPGGLLLILATTGWRVGKWLAPRVERGIDAHLALIESLDETVDELHGLVPELIQETQKTRELINSQLESNRELLSHLRECPMRRAKMEGS